MKLFHFRDDHYGLKSLKERRLKIARIMELNDPFEFLGASLSDPNFRKAMNLTKQQLSEITGILCFSKNWRNPVQWSHYAREHKGICMAFEIPKRYLLKVDYVDKRIKFGTNINIETMKKFLTTKFSHWSYEEEYRLFISLDKNEEENGRYFSEFSEDLKLKQVIIGARSDITRKQVSNALGDLIQNVEVFKARPAFKTFRVVRNKNDKLWA
jgi:hypothetical protein